MLMVYSIEQEREWDDIVRSFKNYDVYWLSGYVKAFRLHGDGEPMLFYYEDNNTRGINVVMKRDVAGDRHFSGTLREKTYFDFSTPYGYGGWLIEGEDTRLLFDVYGRWCRENGIISEFVRFHPLAKNYVPCEDFYDVVQLGEVVTMDLSSPELIWEGLTSANRNKIRKAQKNRVKIYNGRYPEIFEKFREIYNQTMDKDSADSYYYFKPDFYTSILNDLPNNSQVFYAQIPDGTIIAASIMLMSNGMMNYHLSGNAMEYKGFAATNLLIYEAALWGCANGLKTLYLGGGLGSKSDSLFVFKKSFYKGDLSKFYIGKRIFINEKYNELLSMRGTLNENGFFPAYRG